MSKYIIKEWCVTFRLRNYIAPELLPPQIGGLVYGHPGFPDGTQIVTSPIAKVNGREITSKSGSIYILDGDPSAEYLTWCKQNGKVYDPEQPIKVIDKDHTLN